MAFPNVGEQFRQFRILAKAGEGGMGVVFRAEDTRLGRNVALKFLTGIGPVDSETAARARREARSLAALNNPNIVSIHDIDEVDGAPFLVMEWVSGTPLGSSDRGRAWSEDEFLKIALPVAEALAAAHSRNIVHRDVKPGNVLLTDDGGVKLVDFGLAKFSDEQLRITKASGVVGTVAYMSPEQATGGEVGPASDIFSFGVLSYELLAGRRPFGGDSHPAVLYSIVNTPHMPLAKQRPDLSSEVTAIVERCLQKRPEARFGKGSGLAQELQRIVMRRNTAETRDLSARPSDVTERTAAYPEVRYCRTEDDASIAYALHGSGPILVRVLGWFTHLEMEWEWPALRLIWERLGETHTVVRYDGRGIGLSGRWDGEFTEETRQLDLEAVLDAVGAEKVILYGVSEGGWTAGHYAARHPDRVSRLIIYGSYSRGVRFRPGYDEEENRALTTLMRKGWGRDTPEIRQIFTTAYFGPDTDPMLVAHFNNLQRAAADGDTAARYQESLHERNDAKDVLEQIRTPTLIMHCREDRIVPFEEGRLMASIIPGAKFLPFPTRTHYFPLDDEVTHRMADAIDRFTS